MGAVRNFEKSDLLHTVIVTHGRIVTEAMKAARILGDEGISVGIILLEVLKPYDETAGVIKGLMPEAPCNVLFLEEELRSGGMGVHLADELCRGYRFETSSMNIMAVDDSFVEKRLPEQSIYEAAGIDAWNICKTIKEFS